MIVKLADGAFWRSAGRFSVHAFPLFQTAQRRRVRKMRIEREQYNFVKRSGLLKRFHGIHSHWPPIPHRGYGHSIEVRRKRGHQGTPLALRQYPDWRTPPNQCVTASHRHRPLFRYIVGQRLSQEPQGPHWYDVRIQKKISQKWLDRVQRVRPTQLKKHNSNLFSAAQRLPFRSLPFLHRILHSFSQRSEEHTSELQSRRDLVCRLLLDKKKILTISLWLLYDAHTKQLHPGLDHEG